MYIHTYIPYKCIYIYDLYDLYMIYTWHTFINMVYTCICGIFIYVYICIYNMLAQTFYRKICTYVKITLLQECYFYVCERVCMCVCVRKHYQET